MEAFATESIAVDFEAIRRCIGMGADKLMPAVAGIERESRQGERIARHRGKIFMNRYVPHLRPMTGADALARTIRDAGLTIVAATSAEPREVTCLLDIAGVTQLFDDAASSGDAKESKPDPDIVHSALRKADARPEDAVMIGDTPYDVEAAARAGVRAIAFRCGGWSDADLGGAIAIYDGPADLLAQFGASPLCVRR